MESECLGRVGGDDQWWLPLTSFLFPLTLHPAAVTETPPHQFFLRPARRFNMKQITAFLLALFSLGSAEISTFSLPSPWSYTCDRSYIQRIHHPHRPFAYISTLRSNSSIGGHHHAARCVKVPAYEAEVKKIKLDGKALK